MKVEEIKLEGKEKNKAKRISYVLYERIVCKPKEELLPLPKFSRVSLKRIKGEGEVSLLRVTIFRLEDKSGWRRQGGDSLLDWNV